MREFWFFLNLFKFAMVSGFERFKITPNQILRPLSNILTISFGMNHLIFVELSPQELIDSTFIDFFSTLFQDRKYDTLLSFAPNRFYHNALSSLISLFLLNWYHFYVNSLYKIMNVPEYHDEPPLLCKLINFQLKLWN